MQARQAGSDRICRALAAIELAGNEMGDDLGIGLRLEDVAVGLELGAQIAEILDDAVVDDRKLRGRMRMGIGLVGLAMGRPAGVTDADQAFERFVRQADLEVLELALCTAAGELAGFQRRDAGGIIAAIFEPPQSLDDLHRDCFLAQNPDDAAHGRTFPAVAIRPSA